MAIAAVAVLALYSHQPPSYLSAGEFITIREPGLASCTFLPAPLRVGCEPLRATVTEKGSLVVFNGPLKAGVPLEKEGEGGVVYASPTPRFKKFEVRSATSANAALSCITFSSWKHLVPVAFFSLSRRKSTVSLQLRASFLGNRF